MIRMPGGPGHDAEAEANQAWQSLKENLLMFVVTVAVVRVSECHSVQAKLKDIFRVMVSFGKLRSCELQ